MQVPASGSELTSSGFMGLCRPERGLPHESHNPKGPCTYIICTRSFEGFYVVAGGAQVHDIYGILGCAKPETLKTPKP